MNLSLLVIAAALVFVFWHAQSKATDADQKVYGNPVRVMVLAGVAFVMVYILGMVVH